MLSLILVVGEDTEVIPKFEPVITTEPPDVGGAVVIAEGTIMS